MVDLGEAVTAGIGAGIGALVGGLPGAVFGGAAGSIIYDAVSGHHYKPIYSYK